jgi:hypothetical protein
MNRSLKALLLDRKETVKRPSVKPEIHPSFREGKIFESIIGSLLSPFLTEPKIT